jgi:CO dehydrogenase/acetyl-CoA synthase gamma subunit (corrinoid Fe-S protein)
LKPLVTYIAVKTALSFGQQLTFPEVRIAVILAQTIRSTRVCKNMFKTTVASACVNRIVSGDNRFFSGCNRIESKPICQRP